MYKLTNGKSVIRLADGAIIPKSLRNRDWRDYQEWLDEGGVPEPADPEPTNEELIDMAGPVMIAFLRAYAKREGLTLAQIKNAIVNEM